MTGEVAEKLKANKIPGYITQMAYGTSVYVPERTLPDNILVMVATTGPWAQGENREKDDKAIIDWTRKLGHKVWIWNYAINESTMTGGRYGLPGTVQMSPVAIGKYYQRHAPYITGAFLESETDYFIMNYLNWYIFGKVCWNNKADLNAILDEHYRLMFGTASIQMKKFYEELERIWMCDVKGRFMDTPLGPMSVKPSNFDLWEKFYSPGKLAEFNMLFDEAEKSVQNDADSLTRVKFMREQLLGPILNGSKKYFAETDTLKAWLFPVKTITGGNKISIDGKLDDLDWKQSAQSFLLPFKSDNCEVKTKVYALKDSENLYLGFDCEEPETVRMKCPERTENDENIWLDSCVEIHLNASGDGRSFFQMIVNAAGSAYQKSAVKAGADNSDVKKWDSHAVIKTNIGKSRWTVEISIPLKSLGEFKRDGFPINFIRTRGLNGGVPKVMHYTWSPHIKSAFNELENFGTLNFNPKEITPVINNGDFSVSKDSGSIDKWVLYEYNKPASCYSVTIDDTTFIKGGQSLKIVSNGGFFDVEQVPIILKPDTKYHLSFYLKLENIKPSIPAGGGVMVKIWTGKKNFLFPNNSSYTGTIPWTRQGFNFTTDSETKCGGIKLLMQNVTGTAWFDDVSITETDK
jgi:hypothetical protein